MRSPLNRVEKYTLRFIIGWIAGFVLVFQVTGNLFGRLSWEVEGSVILAGCLLYSFGFFPALAWLIRKKISRMSQIGSPVSRTTAQRWWSLCEWELWLPYEQSRFWAQWREVATIRSAIPNDPLRAFWLGLLGARPEVAAPVEPVREPVIEPIPEKVTPILPERKPISTSRTLDIPVTAYEIRSSVTHPESTQRALVVEEPPVVPEIAATLAVPTQLEITSILDQPIVIEEPVIVAPEVPERADFTALQAVGAIIDSSRPVVFEPAITIETVPSWQFTYDSDLIYSKVAFAWKGSFVRTIRWKPFTVELPPVVEVIPPVPVTPVPEPVLPRVVPAPTIERPKAIPPQYIPSVANLQTRAAPSAPVIPTIPKVTRQPAAAPKKTSRPGDWLWWGRPVMITIGVVILIGSVGLLAYRTVETLTAPPEAIQLVPEAELPEPGADARKQFSVELASDLTLKDANRALDDLREGGYPAYLFREPVRNGKIRLRVGLFSTSQEARILGRELVDKRYTKQFKIVSPDSVEQP